MILIKLEFRNIKRKWLTAMELYDDLHFLISKECITTPYKVSHSLSYL